MTDIFQINEQNFPLFFVIAFAWVAVVFGWQYYRHKKRGLVFPSIAPASIRFDERSASGFSHQTMFTRIGGASRCLHVTVTDSEVWVRPIFPFSILASQFDLEHRIQRQAITRAEQSRSGFFSSLLLEYRDERGQLHQLSLRLRRPDDFLRALSLQAQAV